MIAVRYRCGACGSVSEHPADDPIPVCNATSACGLLFDNERLPADPPPVARRLTFRLDGSGYVAGDERAYEVVHRGLTIGLVERAWVPAATPGAEPLHGWWFVSNDGSRRGLGLTRAAAVLEGWSS